MTLSRGVEANSAVAMVLVVPLNKAGDPIAGLLQIGKRFGGIIRTVLGGSKESLIMLYSHKESYVVFLLMWYSNKNYFLLLQFFLLKST
jgi:hypothetical protein